MCVKQMGVADNDEIWWSRSSREIIEEGS